MTAGASESGSVSDLDVDVLRRLHASAITSEVEILRVLRILEEGQQSLIGRRTLRGDAEVARICGLADRELLLECSHVEGKEGSGLFLNFSIDGRSYFFSVRVLARTGSKVTTEIPPILYVAERRDRRRQESRGDDNAPMRVRLQSLAADWQWDADVSDFSPVGLNVDVPMRPEASVGAKVRVRYLDGPLKGVERWGVIRHADARSRENGWRRLGISVSEIPHSSPIDVERRQTIMAGGRFARARQSLSILSAGAVLASSRMISRATGQTDQPANVRVVDYENERGQRLRGIVDTTGDPLGATAVLIPPAWGRTKETLLPLAATIVETFKAANRSVTVLRFDGINRRGESHREPGSERPGSEHIKFKLSHAIDDIATSAKFLRESPEFSASGVILVTFSAASIEGRRALVEDRGRRIRGWISVVGSPDLQSGLRTVSGGIDYVAGAEQGIRFGIREVMGVAADMDLMLEEALEMGLPFLEDARRDMAQIDVPVTWIHGANDAWLDLERVRLVMSSGESRGRRLIEVPTGHQLRNSREALQVFQLIAEHVAEVALGTRVSGAIPNLRILEAKRRAERDRLPRVKTDVRAMWRDYLIGRGNALGIEMLNASDAYRALMDIQGRSLKLTSGARVADVGSGTGSFPLWLVENLPNIGFIEVDEIDYVPEAQARARNSLEGRVPEGMRIRFLECDIDDCASRKETFALNSYDAALLSLVISYVQEPVEVLRSVFAALKPGGRLVLSALRRDADLSRLYLQGLDELRAGRAREVFGSEFERKLDESARSFLNDAARIVDLEEQGVFRFLDADELEEAVTEAGFRDCSATRSFGDPPQAVVVTAVKGI